jgi:flavin reductase (DIM6/NTAB) family NADH-FMN oxidoreductase RutF
MVEREATMTMMPRDLPGVDDAQFRASMRQLAAGVSVVTTIHEGERYGITVTSAASVSDDPPLMSVGVNKQSWICDALMQSRIFCVSVLGAPQLDVATSFSTAPRERRFDAGEWTTMTTGAPALIGAPAVFDCDIYTTIEVKTHFLVIGRIVATRSIESAPLIYRDRKYLTVGDLHARTKAAHGGKNEAA